MKKIDANQYLESIKLIDHNSSRYDYSKTVYRGMDKKIEIKCNRCGKFFWQSAKTHLHRKTQCPCYSNQNLTKDDYFKKAIKAARKNKGQLLSTEYKNSQTKLLWQCQCGHQWQNTLYNIEVNNQWCPKCSRIKGSNKRKKTNEEFIRELSAIHGDRYIYDKVEYKGVFEKIELYCVKCKKMFLITAHSALAGAGCQICMLDKIGDKNRKYTFEEMQDLAKQYGGELISTVFKNVSTSLDWKCSKGHVFKKTPQQIMTAHTWCDVCNVSMKRGEKIVREYFEKLFNKRFPSVRPKWLTHKNGFPLELDGYNDELQIAFEHQGMQHDIFIEHFHQSAKSYKELQERDNFKINKCKEEGVLLILIPELFRKLDPLELPSYIDSIISKTSHAKSIKNKPDIAKIIKEYYSNYDILPYDQAKLVMHQFRITSKNEYKIFCSSGKLPNNIPKDAKDFYEKTAEWISWPDYLGSSYGGRKSEYFWDYKKAKEYVSSLNLKSINEWLQFVKTGKLPKQIPLSPQNVYKRKGQWISWQDWLGYDFESKNAKKAIVMYDNLGEKLKKFNSAKDATKETGISHSHISSCCRYQRLHTKGFQWRFESEKIKKLPPLAHYTIRNQRIAMLDINENLIQIFDSPIDAGNIMNINASYIRLCLRKKIKSTAGYIWKFEKDL